MARHIRPRLAGSPAVPRSAQPESSLGNALHLAPLLWGFICLQHALHRGDPFPGCFGGPDQTALVRPPPQPAQPGRSSTLANKQQPALAQSSSAVMGRGGGANGNSPARQGVFPAPAVHFPAPAVHLVGAYRWSLGNSLLGSSGILAGACLACLSVGLCSRCSPFSSAPLPATDWLLHSAHQSVCGSLRAEGGKKIANLRRRSSLCSGPPGAPALFFEPSLPSTFCTISAYRHFFVHSLLSLWLCQQQLTGQDDETTDRMTSGPL